MMNATISKKREPLQNRPCRHCHGNCTSISARQCFQLTPASRRHDILLIDISNIAAAANTHRAMAKYAHLFSILALMPTIWPFALTLLRDVAVFHRCFIFNGKVQFCFLSRRQLAIAFRLWCYFIRAGRRFSAYESRLPRSIRRRRQLGRFASGAPPMAMRAYIRDYAGCRCHE